MLLMANQTVTGCINFDTGLAEFDQDDCEYSGCLVTGGIHDKQVAVTIDTDLCDDTFFGCVIFPGGTFEVVVPDFCCSGTTGDACGFCTDLPPECINMSFTGWEICCVLGIVFTDMDVFSLPALILDQSDTCIYDAGDFEETSFMQQRLYFDLETECSGEVTPFTLFPILLMQIRVLTNKIELDVTITDGDLIQFIIAAATVDELDDPCNYLLSGHTIPNEFECDDEHFFSGGDIIITPAVCP